MIQCPKCESKEVHSYDNLPLYHSHSEENSPEWIFDKELYFRMKCKECDHTFKYVGQIIEQITPEEQQALKIVLEYADLDLDCQKLLLSLQSKIV